MRGEGANEYPRMRIPLTHSYPVAKERTKIKRGRRIYAKDTYLLIGFRKNIDQCICKRALTGAWRTRYANDLCIICRQLLKELHITFVFVFNEGNRSGQCFEITCL